MPLPAERQSAAERFSVMLLVAPGRGGEHGREGSNCQALIIAWLGQAAVENGFQTENSFMELSRQELNFVPWYLIPRGKF